MVAFWVNHRALIYQAPLIRQLKKCVRASFFLFVRLCQHAIWGYTFFQWWIINIIGLPSHASGSFFSLHLRMPTRRKKMQLNLNKNMVGVIFPFLRKSGPWEITSVMISTVGCKKKQWKFNSLSGCCFFIRYERAIKKYWGLANMWLISVVNQKLIPFVRKNLR